MPNSKRISPVFELLDPLNHPDYEIKETRVSDFLRRYGSGHIEDLPQTSAPEIVDTRTADEMLEDRFVEQMSTEAIDVMTLIDENKERFQEMEKEIELTKKQKETFDRAMKVLNDSSASIDARREAYARLDELANRGKLARARKS